MKDDKLNDLAAFLERMIQKLRSSQTQPEPTLFSERIKSRIFWDAHPSAFVAIWMKYDYFHMSLEDFMHKYIGEIYREDIHCDKKRAIESVILPLYREITGRNLDTNLIAL